MDQWPVTWVIWSLCLPKSLFSSPISRFLPFCCMKFKNSRFWNFCLSSIKQFVWKKMFWCMVIDAAYGWIPVPEFVFDHRNVLPIDAIAIWYFLPNMLLMQGFAFDCANIYVCQCIKGACVYNTLSKPSYLEHAAMPRFGYDSVMRQRLCIMIVRYMLGLHLTQGRI